MIRQNSRSSSPTSEVSFRTTITKARFFKKDTNSNILLEDGINVDNWTFEDLKAVVEEFAEGQGVPYQAQPEDYSGLEREKVDEEQD